MKWLSDQFRCKDFVSVEIRNSWYDIRVKCQEIHCVCGNLNLWGGCRVLYPVLVTVQQCCGQDRPACCVRGHSLSTQYRAELFCGCPGTQHQPAATCQDQTVRTVDTISRGLLQVVGPGSTQSRLRWARRCPCQWEWRAVAPCCCLTCLFSENRNLIMSRWRESCSYHQLSLFFRLLDNRNEMASDHPEQNEGDQENTEQNDLQQIEDLKIQVHTYNSNIHTQFCHNSFDTQHVQWNITWSKFNLPVLTPDCDPRRQCPSFTGHLPQGHFTWESVFTTLVL